MRQPVVDQTDPGLKPCVLPKRIVLGWIRVNRFFKPAMHRQVSLLITHQAQWHDHDWRKRWLLVERREDAALADFDATGSA